MHANMNNGLSINHDLRGLAIAKVIMIYKGRHVPMNMGLQHLEIECEVYEANGVLSVHTVCPKCRHSSWIDGRNKKVEYDKTRGLFVEKFKCGWEMGGPDDHTDFGIGLCLLELVYEGKVAKEA